MLKWTVDVHTEKEAIFDQNLYFVAVTLPTKSPWWRKMYAQRCMSKRSEAIPKSTCDQIMHAAAVAVCARFRKSDTQN